jgi:FlaA1/EpsC-like NDP-sugar epimerase
MPAKANQTSMKNNKLQECLSSFTFRKLLDCRFVIILWSQIVLLLLAYYVSFLLRFDFRLAPQHELIFFETLPVVLLVKLPVFYSAGLFRGWWRYVGISDLLDITKACAATFVLNWLLLLHFFSFASFPRSVLTIDFVMSILVIGGARFAVRLYTETTVTQRACKPTLIVGAGHAARKIAQELKCNPSLELKPVGFVDDDPSKKNIKIHGIRVLGTIDDVPALVTQQGIESVLIAIPSAAGPALQRIIAKCRTCKVRIKLLPPIADRINSTSRIKQLRHVRMEDLLGREPVSLDLASIGKKFRGRTVFITGAGGSIGSELARQIAAFSPAKLVLFDRSENDLYKIEVELTAAFPQLRLVPAVGDILDVRLLRELIAETQPSSIFHAAAYKHVPMMETNCFQAIRNNIFGTYNLALVAKQYGIDDLVMISSDKAVRPTNIMGVSKRVAELVILGLQHQSTRYVSVRFGNVLGSNGSVLPLFQEQIARGGPVTVTHPEVQRYFMTITEAVQLVLQTSVMGKGGEIFVLEMGEPIKIVDLAMNLIRLSGFDPGRDIEIVYTGLRPGEKLFEELMLEQEDIKSTPHKKIRVLNGGQIEFRQMQQWLDQLSEAVETRNVYSLVRTLKQIVPEYCPSKEILSLCDIDRHDVVIAFDRARAGLALTPAADAA